MGQRYVSKPNVTLMSSLNLYAGDWNFENAAHLLRRTTFGPTKAQILEAQSKGLAQTVETLLRERPLADPPVYYNFDNDPNVAEGETWVNTPHLFDVPGLNAARTRSLKAWWFGQMNQHQVSIRERMSLFWHEHFAINDVSRSDYLFHYIDIIQKNMLGDFRTLTEEITICPAMLVFLNGDDNTKQSPNENYARELLELFTIGRGPIAGPGDYTNYTEEDVFSIAKALTGWRKNSIDGGGVSGAFGPNRHDETDKQLSHRFDNIIISNSGDQEYKNVIDIILQKKETAKFICRQLHIWFVGSDINQEVEDNIITPLADLFYDSNYQIQIVLETLLGSEYFNEAGRHGCIIASPLDFIFNTINCLELQFSDDYKQRNNGWYKIQQFAEAQEMAMFAVDSVAGWKAYYQAPQFYEFWINSVSLNARKSLTDRLIEGINIGGYRYVIDLVNFIGTFENPSDPNLLVEEAGKILFVFTLTDEQKTYLKSILLPGLDDFVWAVEYGVFLEDPSDEQARSVIENKLKALFSTLLQMPEYHLI